MALRSRIWKSGLSKVYRLLFTVYCLLFTAYGLRTYILHLTSDFLFLTEEAFDEVGTSDAAQFVDDLLLLVAFVPEEELALG